MTNDLKTYDLVVIGGGPAGITAATAASSFGKSVALADSHQEIGARGSTRERCRAKLCAKRHWPCRVLSRATSMESIVGRANYWENARGRIIGDQDGFLKLLFRQDDLKLIGVHILGELATEVVHIGLVAMMCNASANLFVDACLNLPTLGLLYKTATLNALQDVPLSEKHA